MKVGQCTVSTGVVKTRFLQNALDDIQLVTPNNHLLTLVQRAQGLEFGLNPRTQSETYNWYPISS